MQLGCFGKETVAIQFQKGRHTDVFTDETAVELQTHPLGNLGTDAGTGIVAFLVIVRIVHLAVLVKEGTRYIILYLIITARQAQIVLLTESRLVDEVTRPVLVVIGVGIECKAVAGLT
ncbi:unknown [Bacteroides sp. CAG:633]|nr:unknown [Bacteroides sp. CAG:633]